MKFRMRLERPQDLKPDVLDGALRQSIPRIVRIIESYARQNLGGLSKTGRTLAGLKSRVNVNSKTPRGEVGVFNSNRHHIARFLETGTRGHGPKRKKYMTFSIDGKFIRTKFVKGIRATRWLTSAGERALPEAERELQSAVERVLAAAVTQRVKAVNE